MKWLTLITLLSAFYFVPVWASNSICNTNQPLSQESKELQLFATKLDKVVREQSVQWESQFFRGNIISTASDAASLVNKVLRNSEIAAEIENVRLQFGKDQILWDEYLKAYDRVVPFSDGYLSTIRRADQYLPHAGIIVDYGGGTGNFSAALKASQQERRIVLIDYSVNGLIIAEKKMAAISKQQHGYQIIKADLNSSFSTTIDNVDGAVMNNVFYNFTPEQKVNLLKRIFNKMKSGGILIINDPIPLAQTADSLQKFLTSIAESAVKNGAPMRDFDLAFLVAVNKGVLANPNAKSPFLSTAELTAMAQQTGFVVVDSDLTYYDMTTSLVLRKP